MSSIRLWARSFALPLAILTTGTVAGQDKTVLPATGWGSLEGRITLEGPIPTPRSFEAEMKLHADKQCCLAGKAEEKIDRTWTVDPKTRGVAHVVVFLKAAPQQYLPIRADDRVRKDPVVIDQPRCAFQPFITLLYPSYFDGKNQVATGQDLLLKNSAPVRHNVRASGDQKNNVGFNDVLAPNESKRYRLKPQRFAIPLNCDFHRWMGGYIWVFDHPYAAVTKADGTFAIPRVPAGAEVTVMAWHPAVGYIHGKAGKKMTFANGKQTTVEYRFKAPAESAGK